MFLPTSDTEIKRQDLGQILYEVQEEAVTQGYIGSQIFTPFFVPMQSHDFPVMPKEALFNVYDAARGPKGNYNRVERRFEAGFFSTSEKGLEEALDDRFKNIYSSMFAYEAALAKAIYNDILRVQEVDIAAKVFNTTQWTPVNAATAWSTSSTTNPQSDVNIGKEVMRLLGIVPNALVLTWDAWIDLQEATHVRNNIVELSGDRQKDGTVSLEHLKTYFKLPNILVGGSLYNQNKMGQNADLTDIWGSQYANLCRIVPGGSAIEQPSIGRSIIWNEGATDEIIVENYYNDEIRGEVLRVRHDVDYAYLRSYDKDKAVKSDISAAAGYLIDVTAST